MSLTILSLKIGWAARSPSHTLTIPNLRHSPSASPANSVLRALSLSNSVAWTPSPSLRRFSLPIPWIRHLPSSSLQIPFKTLPTPIPSISLCRLFHGLPANTTLASSRRPTEPLQYPANILPRSILPSSRAHCHQPIDALTKFHLTP